MDGSRCPFPPAKIERTTHYDTTTIAVSDTRGRTLVATGVTVEDTVTAEMYMIQNK